jgi:hypothetical protein
MPTTYQKRHIARPTLPFMYSWLGIFLYFYRLQNHLCDDYGVDYTLYGVQIYSWYIVGGCNVTGNCQLELAININIRDCTILVLISQCELILFEQTKQHSDVVERVYRRNR